jgi:hypothetical protein
MLYQLPSGKVIYLSIEEFLSMSDLDIHELTNSGYGMEPSYGNHFEKRSKKDSLADKKEEPSLDYTPESEEIDTIGPIDLQNLPEE